MIDITSLLAFKQETSNLEFKGEFDGSTSAFLEVLKDIIAIANSGGGHILFGFDSNGEPTNKDVSAAANIDPAVLNDKIKKYTSVNLASITIHKIAHEQSGVCVYEIGAPDYPIVFSSSGTYQVSQDKQNSAFQRGVIYFRHGAKSEPADNEDIRKFVNRKIESIKNFWLSGIRQVVEAPENSVINILKEDAVVDAPSIFISDDANAPHVQIKNIDDTHPLKGKQICDFLNNKFPNRTPIKNQSILYANQFLNVNGDYNFVYRQQSSVIKYTNRYLGLLMKNYAGNPSFFEEAKSYCLANKSSANT